jgi:glucose-fructose oxidoreductase
MALTLSDAQEMIDICAEHHVRLMICYYQRFNARHQQVKSLLDEGAIGQVTAARFNFSMRQLPRPDFWRHEPAVSGGGPLMDLAPHSIDLLRYLCGPVVSVSALVDTLATESPVEDTATLLLRLENGVQAVITTHWSTANHAPLEFNRFELYGTEGTIVAAPHNTKDSSGRVRLITAEGEREISVGLGGPNTHVAMLQSFGKAIAGSREVPVPGQEGLASLRVIQAAYQSAQTGQTISVA